MPEGPGGFGGGGRRAPCPHATCGPLDLRFRCNTIAAPALGRPEARMPHAVHVQHIPPTFRPAQRGLMSLRRDFAANPNQRE